MFHTGSIIDIAVKEGDTVEKGDVLLVISAMKMEMNVSAPTSGTVKKIHIASGQKMAAGDLLIDIE